MLLAFPIRVISSTIEEKLEFISNDQVSQAYYSWQLTERARKLIGTRQGQCTVAVRNFLGLGSDQIKGKAKNNEANSQVPEVGSIIITSESSNGHVGVVLFFTDTQVTIYESNVPLGSEIAGIRTLNINDPRIRGYLLY